MRKSMKVLAGAAALALGSVAQGAVTLEFQEMFGGSPPPDQYGFGPLPGYKAYVLTAVSTQGKITAVDFASGAYGITGELHQDWVPGSKSNTATPFHPQTYEYDSYDTHFIFNDAGATANVTVVAGTAFEDNSGTGSPVSGSNSITNGVYYGLGTQIEASFGINGNIGGNQKEVTPIAYLVVAPSSAPLTVFGKIATENGAVEITAVVPEPATAGLLALGAVGLLARRRRS